MAKDRKFTPNQLEKALRQILEEGLGKWLPELECPNGYHRVHDDHDGTREGVLSVVIGPDGDCYIATDRPFPMLRFRNRIGGGVSLRTQQAILILALAIHLDDEQEIKVKERRQTQ